MQTSTKVNIQFHFAKQLHNFNKRLLTLKVQQKKQQTKKQDKEEQQFPYKDYSQFKIFDIAANLSDERYQGVYHGKKLHEQDFDIVIKRAQQYGVRKFLFAAGYIHDAEESHKLSLYSDDFYSTIGIHPCRANEPFKHLSQDATQSQKEEALKQYYDLIESILQKSEKKEKIVAIGECGLDYDRFEYADKETQNLVFPHHFDLAQKYNLPMYLHSRSTDGDFPSIVKQNRHKFSHGVVHSFTGDSQELQELLAMDLYIGINGCSLKTKENIEVVKQVPLDKLMIETDCPYCDIRQTHESFQYCKTKFQKTSKGKYSQDKMMKDRNEPCTIVQVVEVLANILQRSEEEVSQIAWENSLKMFNLKE